MAKKTLTTECSSQYVNQKSTTEKNQALKCNYPRIMENISQVLIRIACSRCARKFTMLDCGGGYDVEGREEEEEEEVEEEKK